MISKLHTFLCALCALCGSTLAADRPNVLFIMSDDHAAHAIGAYGGRLAKLDPTPTIDRLAKEGVLFENAFCPNAICAPSRACIITGQYPHTNGAYDLRGAIESERQYLAIEMKKAGYHTAMIGKWHLKKEPGAFDFYSVLPGQGSYHNPSFRTLGDQPWPKNVIKFDGMHSSDAITDQSLKWLEEGWDREKPFFLMHHFKAPHDYFEHAKRYDAYLKDIDIPEPENLWNQSGFGSLATRGKNGELIPHIGTSIGDRNPRRSYSTGLPRRFPKDFPKDYDPSKLSEEEVTRYAYNAYLKNYLRCVKGVDDNLARLFGYLERIGQFDNTVIIYTGDQGFMLGEHDYQDKRWMYEESMRTPFLVRYPKTIKAGSRSAAIVENVDYAPTMLGFAGIKTPGYMQGRSFKTICETGAEPQGWKQAAYYRYWMHMSSHDNPGHVGIRTKEHKLIYYYGANYRGEYRTPPAWELYDLKQDPKEVVNQYDNPTYAATVSKLKQQLAALRKKVGDTGEDFPELEKIVQEFWDYNAADRAKAEEISSTFLQTRLAELSRRSAPKRRPSRIQKSKDGWILPAKSSAPLRKHQNHNEISRSATYKISHSANPSFNVDNAHLLSGTPPTIKQHAFHTPEVDRPYVDIKLENPSHLSHVHIINRTGSESLQARAAGLTLWLSSNGKEWLPAWQAQSVQPKWDVSLDQTAQYLRVGLPRQGTLHLNQIIVFGKTK